MRTSLGLAASVLLLSVNDQSVASCSSTYASPGAGNSIERLESTEHFEKFGFLSSYGTANAFYFEYDTSLGDWVVTQAYEIPGLYNYQQGADDLRIEVHGGEDMVLVASDPMQPPPPGAGSWPPPSFGGADPGVVIPQFWALEPSRAQTEGSINSIGDCIRLAEISVSAIHFVRTWITLTAWGGMWGILDRSPPYGGSAPSPFPQNCNTGDPAADDHEEVFDEMWEHSGFDEGFPLEDAAFGIPNSSGGYDYFWFGTDVPGHPSGCSISFAQNWAMNLPEPGTWPDGAVLIHSHPYLPNANERPCPEYAPYIGGASPADLAALAAVESQMQADIELVVIDPLNIYIYDEQTDSTQAGMKPRCGY